MKRLLRSHAASTLGSRSVRKEACCIEKTAALSRHNLDLSPCAKRHVPAKRLLRSHATSSFGSRSVRKEACCIEKTAAFSRHKHTWISLRAQKGMFRQKNLMHSHAASTLGSRSVRKQTCSCDNTAAFSRHEHTWTSLRAQRGMFRRKDCCVLTPRAHLDLAACAKRHVASKRLLRYHATSTLGSLSVRKEACSGEKTVAFSRREHTWISLRAQRDMFRRKDCCDLALPPKIQDFYLRAPVPVSTVKRAHVPYPKP